MPRHEIYQRFDALKQQAKIGLYAPANTQMIDNIYSACLSTLGVLSRENLRSSVQNKRYFVFTDGTKFSRAINADLYNPDYSNWLQLQDAMKTNTIESIDVDALSRILYTMAISFCACIDLINKADRQTPGSFFGYFVAYFFAWRVGVEPQTSIQILSMDDEHTRLPTDYIFNLGPKQRKFHVPVKLSTRERAIMLWAHQKLLDGVYGIDRFMGTPVLLTETKTDIPKKEVSEICLPDQWKLYQLYVAKLKRIYYLDIPAPYEKLNQDFPPLIVKPFSDFFQEWSTLTPS